MSQAINRSNKCLVSAESLGGAHSGLPVDANSCGWREAPPPLVLTQSLTAARLESFEPDPLRLDGPMATASEMI
jgi:hypothetical protein